MNWIGTYKKSCWMARMKARRNRWTYKIQRIHCQRIHCLMTFRRLSIVSQIGNKADFEHHFSSLYFANHFISASRTSQPSAYWFVNSSASCCRAFLRKATDSSYCSLIPDALLRWELGLCTATHLSNAIGRTKLSVSFEV